MAEPSTKYHAFPFIDDDRPWTPLRAASSVSSISGLTTKSSCTSSHDILPHCAKDAETCSLFSALSSIPNVELSWSVQLCSALGDQFRIVPRNETGKKVHSRGNPSFPPAKKSSVPFLKTTKKPATINRTVVQPAARYHRTFEADPVTFDWGEFWETRRKCLHWLQKYCITSSSTKKTKRR